MCESCPSECCVVRLKVVVGHSVQYGDADRVLDLHDAYGPGRNGNEVCVSTSLSKPHCFMPGIDTHMAETRAPNSKAMEI